ncbi:MAG TPA: LuxR family transcriptional regulator [Baekduia sp.]|uniref:LuxR family transcriptional regulator n=1 Tax=Baekduia sp. TaxID=2600305 RepID=UPI002CEC9C0B|nr:LuxR family transcriptional regulator [Baekduia sp.]HMJ32782.1 LuxR family transcriptional regulator [Baekduia sp.]
MTGAADAAGKDLLLERGTELAALETLVAAVAAGRGGVALVEGPAGIGSSALLRALQDRAGAADLPMLRARGSDLGRHVPFGLIRRLLDPAVRARPELLSQGLAAVARPVFDGTLGVLPSGTARPLVEGLVDLVAGVALAGAAGPLIVVDDAHWADRATLQVLAELALRVDELPVGLALAVRTGEDATDPALVDRLRLAAGPALLRPAPLTDGAVARLVERDVPHARPSFAAAVAAATRGNPMLVGEVLAEAAARATRADGPAPAVAALVPETLARSVLVALERMGEAALALAAAVAVLDEGPLRRAADLAGLDAATAEATADALAARDVLSLGEPVRFEHPVVAAAVVHALTPFERARLHRRAAERLAADDVADEAVAPYLMAARPEGDPWTVGVLRRAAASALGGGEPATAARLLHRALDEPPPPEHRGEVLVEVARAEAAAGDGAAIDRFEAALRRVRDPPHRVAAWHGLSRLLLARADVPGAVAAAARGHAELAPGDPAAELLLADELAAAVLDPARAADMAAQRARLVEEVRAGRPPTEPTLLAHLVMHLGWGAIDLHRVPELARAAVAEDPLVDPHARGFAAAFVAGALNWVDDLDGAAAMLDAAVLRAAQLGDPVAEANVRCTRAWTSLYRGRIPDARRDLEAVAGLDRLAWPLLTGLAAQPLTLVRLELGDVAGAAAALQQAEAAGPQPGDNWLRGHVRLAQRDAQGALEAFLAEGALLEDVLGLANPNVLSWRTGAAVAAHRLGDGARAGALVAQELDRTRELGLARALGAALRVAGFVAADAAAGLELLEESVAVLDGTPARLELARSLTELGAARRRDRRRLDARPVLERALEVADACGATALATRALGELQAAGARPRRRTESGPSALTASERRVAQLAAEGATTREIATQLSVSPKTVETHLTRTYRKLGVRSRPELPEALAGGVPPPV